MLRSECQVYGQQSKAVVEKTLRVGMPNKASVKKYCHEKREPYRRERSSD